jgi:hypothetical protein
VVEHRAQPGLGEAITAPSVPFTVEGSHVRGTVVGMAWTGNEMTYLVVSADEQRPPVWINENDVDVAYVGKDRPGEREPMIG